MNKLGCLISMFFTCVICDAQNLVPNGGFEQHSACPTSGGQIDLAVDWINPTTGTSDYFHSCAISQNWSVPDNLYGYQNAHSENAYSGILVWFGNIPNYREYIEVPLTSPLVANNCYHFEMFVSLADTCTRTSIDIGVYFSDTLVSGIANFNPLPFIPQIQNTNGVLPDTMNWVIISGIYTATGGENHMIIGNFKDDTNTSTVVVNGVGYNATELYIDDVSLTPCTAIEEQNEIDEITISPNPFSANLKIETTNNELSEIILYDIASRNLLQQKFTNSINLYTEHLVNGIYLFEVRNKNRVIKKGKVLKN